MSSDRSLSSGKTSEVRSLPAPLAQWSPSRDCWETDHLDLLSGLPDVWRETWPTSGMTRNGSAYELPTWVDAMGDSGSSCSESLPTPTAGDGDRSSLTYGRGNLTLAGALLPTPNVKNNENRQSEGFGMNLGTALGLV